METGKFFKTLARRFRKENNLSDITWAILDNVEPVARDLLELFGISVPQDQYIEVKREYKFKNSDFRIDFAFIYGKNIFLQENKIWDRNYHFDNFSKEFKKINNFDFKNIGIIANHYLNNIDLKKGKKIVGK